MAKILIVDDRAENRRFLLTLLGYGGHELLEASDGAEALGEARRAHPDLIITDLIMPKLDGYELVRQLRREPEIADTPVIFYTAGYDEAEANNLARAGGVNRVLPKPGSPEEILRAVNESLQMAVVTKPILPPEEFDREHLRLVTDKLASKVLELEAANEVLTKHTESLRRQTEMLDLANVMARDMDDRITLWNSGAQKMYGWMKEEVIGLVSHQLLRTKFPQPLEEIKSKLLSEGKWEGELIYTAKDGSLVYVLSHWIVHLDEQGNPTAILEINSDITEHKRAEESLSESEARLSGIIESAIDAIITVDAHQRIVLFNRAAERIFMCEASEAIGQSLDRILPPRFRAMHQQYIEGFGETGISTRAMAATREVSGLRSNGEEFPLEASISQFQSAGEKFYTVILRDITERKRVEQQVIESREQLRALTAYLQTIREEERTRIAREVHDVLGQLLTALKMDMSMYAKRLPDSIESERLAQLKESINGMQNLTDEIIKTVQHISTELRPGVLDTLGLVDAVEWQAHEFEARTQITCVCHLPEGDLELSRDKVTAMFRIFQELLTNVVRHAHATKVEIEVLTENGDVSLHVRDNGRGITEEELSDTASLGLLGMRERARLFDGDVTIKGEKAKGTDVRVRMPLNESNAAAKTAGDARHPSS